MKSNVVTLTVTTSDLVSITEAARLLGKKRMQIYRWIRTGKIIPFKLGDRQYIAKSDVERLINNKGEK